MENALVFGLGSRTATDRTQYTRLDDMPLTTRLWESPRRYVLGWFNLPIPARYISHGKTSLMCGYLLLEDMEKDGGKREWSKQVHLVPPSPKAGVSSTKIRDAAKAGDWSTVQQLCSPSVAQWVQDENLYG